MGVDEREQTDALNLERSHRIDAMTRLLKYY